MKTWQHIMWAIVILILGFFLTVILVPSDDSQPTPSPKQVEESSAFMTQFKGAYMESCTEGDPTMEAFCMCAYKYVVNTIGEDGLEDMAYEYYKTDEMPQRLLDVSVDAAVECMDHYPEGSEQL